MFLNKFGATVTIHNFDAFVENLLKKLNLYHDRYYALKMFDLSESIGIRNTFLAILFILLNEGLNNLLPLVEPKLYLCEFCQKIVKEISNQLGNLRGERVPVGEFVTPDLILVNPHFLIGRRLLIFDIHLDVLTRISDIGCVVEVKKPSTFTKDSNLLLVKLFDIAVQLVRYAAYVHATMPVYLLTALYEGIDSKKMLQSIEELKRQILNVLKYLPDVVYKLGVIIIRSKDRFSLNSNTICVDILPFTGTEPKTISTADVVIVLNKLLYSLGKGKQTCLCLQDVGHVLFSRELAQGKQREQRVVLVDYLNKPVYCWHEVED